MTYTSTLMLYPLLCAAAYYLFARAKVTEWLWSRYPAWLDELTVCAACSGFWYGAGCGLLGWWRGWSFVGLPSDHWTTIALCALCGLVWTPLVAVLHLAALQRLGVTGGTTSPPYEDDRRA